MNGEIIKKIRLEKGYILADLAAKTGYTASYISQIERNIKQPSLEALRKISDALNTPIITFLMEDSEEYISSNVKETYNFAAYTIIRETERKKAIMPEVDTKYQIITPIYKENFDKPRMIGFYNELKPGDWTSEKLVSHESEESIIVIEGQVDVYVDEKVFTLFKGDSIYITSNIPHNINNSTDIKAIIVAYQSPAMY